MKIIRRSTFETNSSSCHSLCIQEYLPYVEDIPEIENNTIIVNKGFYREWERYNDTITKISFCYLSFEHNESLLDILKAVVNDKYKNYIDIKIGFEDEKCNIKPTIDHQSFSLLENTLNQLSLEEKIEYLDRFIFDKNQWLVTGSDEEYQPFNIIDFPIYLKDGSVHQTKYIYSIHIDGYDKVIGLNEYPTSIDILYEIFGGDLFGTILNNRRKIVPICSWNYDQYAYGEFFGEYEEYYKKNLIPFRRQYFMINKCVGNYYYTVDSFSMIKAKRFNRNKSINCKIDYNNENLRSKIYKKLFFHKNPFSKEYKRVKCVRFKIVKNEN